MSNVINEIRNWGISKGIDTMKQNKRVFVANIIEELLEGINVKDDDITQWLTNSMIMHEDLIDKVTEEDYIDSLGDIVVFAITEMTKYGYEPNLVMKEVLKEISSSRQDPKQAVRWHAEGKGDGEKWKKWKDQHPDTLYKANFKTCKRKKS